MLSIISLYRISKIEYLRIEVRRVATNFVVIKYMPSNFGYTQSDNETIDRLLNYTQLENGNYPLGDKKVMDEIREMLE